MKELNIYKVRDLALASRRAVYTNQQLANLMGKPKEVAKVYASRLARRGLAGRPIRGRLAFVDDDHVIATQLVEPSYISLHSALSFHQMLSQVPRYIECVTPRNSRRYPALGIVYHRMPPSLFFGYERYAKAGSYVFVADPEKAVVDGVYLNLMPRNVLAELLDRLDAKKLASHVRRYEGRGRRKLERWLL